MKAKILTQFFILVFIAGALCLTSCSKTDKAPEKNQGSAGGDSVPGMIKENLDYIAGSNINLGTSAGSYTKTDTEETAVKYSVNPNLLNDLKSGSRTIAVINYKAAGDKKSFYTLDASLAGDSITYSLMQNKKLVESQTFQIVIPGTGVDCDVINAAADTIIEKARVRANNCCCPQRFCIRMCINGAPAFVMFEMRPTSFKCRWWNVVSSWHSINRDLLLRRTVFDVVEANVASWNPNTVLSK